MAFKGLKRFFSLGSKKNKTTNKRANTVPTTVSTPLLPIAETDDSFTSTQLLRSASARYAVVNEIDCHDLPPLPHPINHVLPGPTTSCASLSSAATSISSMSRGTYNVTVHGRKRHAHTEFPNANRDLDNEPQRNNTQLLGLRSDPSITSLLSLYDEHGRLPTHTFSNSPPKEGRAQVQRSGSTLRQLLGNPDSVNSRDGREGDISWAERFLGETQSMVSRSSTSSLPLDTPDTDAHIPQTPFQQNLDDSFLAEDLSSMMQENPAISSLEVELSDISHTPPRPINNSPYSVPDPKTPQRASQVFGFLTTKRRSRAPEEDERSLPELPSVFNSPSADEDSPPTRSRSRSHFSSDSSAESIQPRASTPATPIEPDPPSIDVNMTVKAPNDVHVIMAHGPTKVIVTAPTPSYHHDHVAPSRVPRGPRSHHRPRSSRHAPTRDSFTTVPTRRHVSRSSSLTMSTSRIEVAEPPPPVKSDKGKRRSILSVFDKENLLNAKPELPRTPLRTSSISRPFNRGPSYRASPASSSMELSSVGQQLMGDMRQQRARAREQERRGRSYI